VNGKIHETLVLSMDKNTVITRKSSGIFEDNTHESLKSVTQCNYLFLRCNNLFLRQRIKSSLKSEKNTVYFLVKIGEK